MTSRFTEEQRKFFLEQIKKYNYKELTPTQYRIENIVDVYPKSKKYCIFWKGKWGRYDNLDKLIISMIGIRPKSKRVHPKKKCICGVCTLVIPEGYTAQKVVLL